MERQDEHVHIVRAVAFHGCSMRVIAEAPHEDERLCFEAAEELLQSLKLAGSQRAQ